MPTAIKKTPDSGTLTQTGSVGLGILIYTYVVYVRPISINYKRSLWKWATQFSTHEEVFLILPSDPDHTPARPRVDPGRRRQEPRGRGCEGSRS